jgi:hypothetical protein
MHVTDWFKRDMPAPTLRQIMRVAMPAEHGGWSFLVEPIALGILVAPRLISLVIAGFYLSAFFLYQPLRPLWADISKARVTPRGHTALYAVMFFGGVALVCLVVMLMTEWRVIIPLMIFAVLGATQFIWSARAGQRTLLREFIAAAAVATSVMAMAVAANTSYVFVGLLWLIMLSRAASTLFHIRQFLYFQRGKPHYRAVDIGLHCLGALVALALFWQNGARLGIPFCWLAFRVILGWWLMPKDIAPKWVGISEAVVGGVFLILAFIGLP